MLEHFVPGQYLPLSSLWLNFLQKPHSTMQRYLLSVDW